MLIREREVSTVGDLGGKQVNLSFDASSMDHLMGIMSNMYSDTISAIVRELATNALDSHAESGNPAPIEITTPNAMNPNFVVRDFGIGMSTQDVEETFLRYGASTKRTSDVASGCFGIGSKSPLAYGSQTYNVSAVKDGVKTVVAVGRNESSSAVGEVFTSSTTEPNGVTISVPVNNRMDHSLFENAAETFQFYADAKVLVNGRVKPDRPEEFINLSARFEVAPRSEYGQRNNRDIVVMGNVHYRLDPNIVERFTRNGAVIIYVDMGEVRPSPTREDLIYTEATKNAIERYRAEFIETLAKFAQEEISAATNRSQAVKTKQSFMDICSDLSSMEFTYRGDVIPDQVPFLVAEGVSFSIGEYGVTGISKSPARTYRAVNPFIGYDSNGKTLVITNYSNARFTRQQGEKVYRYIENNLSGVTNTRAIFTSEPLEDLATDDLKWFEDGYVFADWNDIRSEKVQALRKDKKDARLYEVGENEQTSYARPDATKDIYYITQTEIGELDTTQGRLVKLLADGEQLVFTKGIEKMLLIKEFPKALSYNSMLEKRAEEFFDSLTEEERTDIEWHYNSFYGKTMLSGISPEGILDPEIKEYIENCGSITYTKAVSKYSSFWRGIGNLISYETKMKFQDKMPDVEKNRQAWYSICAKYPLLRDADIKRNLDHVRMYVNMIYVNEIQNNEMESK